LVTHAAAFVMPRDHQKERIREPLCLTLYHYTTLKGCITGKRCGGGVAHVCACVCVCVCVHVRVHVCVLSGLLSVEWIALWTTIIHLVFWAGFSCDMVKNPELKRKKYQWKSCHQLHKEGQIFLKQVLKGASKLLVSVTKASHHPGFCSLLSRCLNSRKQTLVSKTDTTPAHWAGMWLSRAATLRFGGLLGKGPHEKCCTHFWGLEKKSESSWRFIPHHKYMLNGGKMLINLYSQDS
jgi:hypothetical protein